MQLFFVENIDQNLITLTPEESRHAVKVLRKKVGDTINIVDGEGGMYEASIIDPNASRCIATLTRTIEQYEKLPYNLHIAIAPTKNIERTEWFMEKSTEIGIGAFTPILAEHSERKTVNEERLEKVIVSAMKQSVKAYKPKLNEITKFSDFIKQDFGDSELYIAHCSANFEREHLKTAITKGTDIVILIGPEGDFSDSEIELAQKRGFKSISLGASRLRTETAALYATSIVSLKF